MSCTVKRSINKRFVSLSKDNSSLPILQSWSLLNSRSCCYFGSPFLQQSIAVHLLAAQRSPCQTEKESAFSSVLKSRHSCRILKLNVEAETSLWKLDVSTMPPPRKSNNGSKYSYSTSFKCFGGAAFHIQIWKQDETPKRNSSSVRMQALFYYALPVGVTVFLSQPVYCHSDFHSQVANWCWNNEDTTH